MKLPWKQDEKIDELEQEKQELKEKIDELKEEKQSYKERFEAEKDRRSKLSAEKQKTEEKINKLRQKLENETEETGETVETEDAREIHSINLQETKRILHKLESVESPEEDLLTVYSPKNIGELGDQQGLKGSVSRENYRFLSDDKSFAAFIDNDFFGVKLKCRPFSSPDWKLSDRFDIGQISSFIEDRKKWAAVSAGETIIFEEEKGEILGREEVSSRVDSKQKKGGFSQGRFERKRQEQIDQHVKMVEEEIDDETLLVGEKSLCKELPGTYLGGFNHDKGSADALYNFRMVLK